MKGCKIAVKYDECGAYASSKERFGVILAFGLVAMFFWQIFVNVGGAMGLIPVTGVTLPFLSYGGSSLLMDFIAIGLLLNVGMRRFMF